MSDEQYWTIPSAFALFHVSSQETIRNWAVEFEQYLSEDAKPEKGETRRFNRDDMRVLALVDMMRQEGKGYDAIHVALKGGDRAELPTVQGNGNELAIPSHSALLKISATIEENRELLEKNQALQIANTRLQTLLDVKQEYEAKGEAERKQLQEQVQALMKQIAVLEYRLSQH